MPINSGSETSVKTLAQLVKTITGGKPEMVFNARNDGGPSRLCADIRLAQEKLGYQPVTRLEDGLRLTMENDPRIRQK